MLTLPRFSRITWLWLGVVLLALLNTGLLLFSGYDQPNPEMLNEQLEQDTLAFERLSFWQRLLKGTEAQEAERRSAFDGKVIDPDTQEHVVSVMIDNFSLARPQHSGIRSASLVYEALAEGGITRLMLVFPYQDINRVGPVRSARDYFVDFAEEYGGLYVHAGGSPMALDQLWASERVYSIEEDDREKGLTYSFRDDNYDAPHNLFFDLLLTREWAQDRGYGMPEAKVHWCFQESLPENVGENAATISLNFSNDVTSSYYVQFEYDESLNAYRRYFGYSQRTPHIDSRDNLQIAPTNLIVQVSPTSLIAGDDKERLEMDHLGVGDAYFYRAGKVVTGSWSKPTLTDVTTYYDEAGNEICLQPGQTWVAIVDNEDLVTSE